MKYLLAEKSQNPLSYDEQMRNCGESSHKYILDEIRHRLTNPTNERSIKERVTNLKNFRILADYTDMKFSQEESLECFAEADGIIRNLKTLFNA